MSCSWDYLTRSAANLAYNYCLLGFEFVLPVSVIVVCYVGIVVSVRRQAGELSDMEARGLHQAAETSAEQRQQRRVHEEKRRQERKLAKVRGE